MLKINPKHDFSPDVTGILSVGQLSPSKDEQERVQEGFSKPVVR